jgi:polysaccharide deacetylase 2 family uncharacterized protein YibQ
MARTRKPARRTKRSGRSGKGRRKPSRSGASIRRRALLVLLVVVAAFAVAAVRFLQSDRGAFFLLDRGVTDRYALVQGMVDDAVEGGLQALGVDPDDVERTNARLRTGGLERTIRNLRVPLPPGLSLAQVNVALTDAVGEAGGSVVLCREFQREGKAGAIEFWPGSRRYPTHRVRVYEGRSYHDFSPVGFALPEKPQETGREPPFTLEPGPASEDGSEPEAIPEPAPPLGRIALIVDDFGYSLGRTQRAMLELDPNLTISVLPTLRKSKQTSDEARDLGHEVILHLPMEPEGWPGVDPGIPPVTSEMDDVEIEQLVRRYLENIPGRVGANNHMGSRATADPRVMRAVLSVFAEEGLYFLDSSTTPHSVVGEARRALGVPGETSDLFLDGEGEDEVGIVARFRKVQAIARERGRAVAICHPRAKTLRALRRELPGLREAGLELVPLSRLVR